MKTTEALKAAREALEDSNGLLRTIGGEGVEQALAQIHDNENALSALSASTNNAEQQPIPDGWIFMRHPSRFDGKWLPARVWEEDGVKMYMPWDSKVLSDLEWDERSKDWEIYASAPQASDSSQLVSNDWMPRLADAKAEWEADRAVCLKLLEKENEELRAQIGNSQPVSALTDTRAVIFDALRRYKLTNAVCSDDPGQNYPLVDLLTPDGKSIAEGEEEIENIADAILDALLSATSQPSAWNEAFQRGRDAGLVEFAAHAKEYYEPVAAAFIANDISAIRQQAPAVQEDRIADLERKLADVSTKHAVACSTLELVKAQRTAAQKALAEQCRAAQTAPENPCPLCDGHGAAPVWVGQTAPVNVPSGYAIVPVEPTRAQIQAAHDGALGAADETMTAKVEDYLIEMYKDFVSFAPSSPIAANSEDAKDAERYRWLTKLAYIGRRYTAHGTVFVVSNVEREVPVNESYPSVSAAIDAAIAATQQKKEGEA